MSTKSLKSQLLAAVAMTLVACIALGSSTYAWFAMNNKVTATGMTVKTQVGNNLFIAGDTLDSNTKLADSEFKTSLVTNIDGTLEPVSTINGATFFYTKPDTVTAEGKAGVAYLVYNESAFQTDYAVANAVGYVDYVFQLKAVNADSTAKNIALSKLDLVYGATDAAAGYQAFRAAVFVQDITSDTPTGADAANLKAIYMKEAGTAGASYFTDGKAVKQTSEAALADNLGTVLHPNGDATIEAPVGTTYYKVIVRLWLEGEDEKCTNDTFAALKDNWMLNVAWEFGGTKVEYLNATAAGAKVTMGGAAIGAATVIDGTSYYALGVAVDGKDAYTTEDAIANVAHVYVLEGSHPIEVTNRCDLTTLPTP